MGFPTPVMSITRSVPARSLPRSRQWPTAPNQSKERSRGCDGRLRFRLQSRRRRAIVGHGVVSTGAPTPALIWVSPPGDYAIVNSNHIPDGTWRNEGRHRIADLKGMIKVMSREVHQLSWELRPTALDDLGLEAAIA